MHVHRLPPLAFALMVVLACAPVFSGDAPSVFYTSQERTVSASGDADDATSSDTGSVADGAVDFSHFENGVGVPLLLDSGIASTSAYQNSVLAGQGIVAFGRASGAFYLGGPSSAFIVSRSELEVAFELPAAADYTLEGTLVEQQAYTALTLEGPSGTVHSLSPAFGTLPVSESGTLPPGAYTLRLVAWFEVGTWGPIQFGVDSWYDVALDFGSGGLRAPGGEVPDGSDVTAGSPLTVSRLPDGLVHVAWARSCRYGDDDFAVYEAPLGDPFGFAPVTCTTGGDPVFEFVPAFESAAFLVTPHDDLTEGSYGDRSDGVERPPSPAACYPHDVGEPVCP